MKLNDPLLSVVGLHKNFPGIVCTVTNIGDHENSSAHAEIDTPGNLQGLRHPRHRRQDADARIVELIGQAIGSEARDRGAHDSRHRPRRPPVRARARRPRSPRGLQASGVDVIDVGQVATPMLYFAAHHLDTHLGRDGHRLAQPARVQRAQDDAGGRDARGRGDPGSCARASRAATSRAAAGGYRAAGRSASDYLERIAGDVKLARPMKLVVDCGNGVAGATAPELYRRLGCEVDRALLRGGRQLPQSPPGPVAAGKPRRRAARARRRARARSASPSTATATASAWSPRAASIIYPDRQLMLFAADVLTRNPGAEVIFDVKSTRNLFAVDPQTRRQAADVENRAFVHQAEAAGNRRAARGRDERARLLQGTLVRLRRRALRRRAPAGDPVARARPGRRAGSAARRGQHAGAAPQARRRRELRADGQAEGRRRASTARAKSSRSTGCASSTPTASGSRARPTPRRSSCCASRPTTQPR